MVTEVEEIIGAEEGVVDIMGTGGMIITMTDGHHLLVITTEDTTATSVTTTALLATERSVMMSGIVTTVNPETDITSLSDIVRIVITTLAQVPATLQGGRTGMVVEDPGVARLIMRGRSTTTSTSETGTTSEGTRDLQVTITRAEGRPVLVLRREGGTTEGGGARRDFSHI